MPMSSPEQREGQQRTLRIIWGALLLSVGVYALVGVLMRPAGPPPEGLETVRMVLIAAAAGSTAATFVMRNVFAARERTLASYFTRCIVTWALAESVAIFGLVLRQLGDGVTFLFAGAAWSAVLLVLLAPTRRDMDDYIKSG